MGGGSQMLADAPPLSHTQWDRNKVGREALNLGFMPAGLEGGGPDAWVPP